MEHAIARAERERLLKLDDLKRLLERHPRRPGTPALRAILQNQLPPATICSKAEAVFEEIITEAGLPKPLFNAPVGRYRVDAYWPRHRLAVEIDGYRYHGTRRRFEGDRRRGARPAAMGIQVIPLSWRQITRERLATAVQLGQVLARAEALIDARPASPDRRTLGKRWAD